MSERPAQGAGQLSCASWSFRTVTRTVKDIVDAQRGVDESTNVDDGTIFTRSEINDSIKL